MAFYNDTLGRIQPYINGPAAIGNSSGTSTAIVGQMIQIQVTILAYIDVFVALGVIAAVMVSLPLTLRSINQNFCKTGALNIAAYLNVF